MLYSRYPLDQSLSLFRLQQKTLPNSAIEVVLTFFSLQSRKRLTKNLVERRQHNSWIRAWELVHSSSMHACQGTEPKSTVKNGKEEAKREKQSKETKNFYKRDQNKTEKNRRKKTEKREKTNQQTTDSSLFVVRSLCQLMRGQRVRTILPPSTRKQPHVQSAIGCHKDARSSQHAYIARF